MKGKQILRIPQMAIRQPPPHLPPICPLPRSEAQRGRDGVGVAISRLLPMLLQPPTQAGHMANDNDVGHECSTYDTAGEIPPRVPPLTPPQPSPTGGGGRTAELRYLFPHLLPEPCPFTYT